MIIAAFEVAWIRYFAFENFDFSFGGVNRIVRSCSMCVYYIIWSLNCADIVVEFAPLLAHENAGVSHLTVHILTIQYSRTHTHEKK